jgi:DNA gyrase subunit B
MRYSMGMSKGKINSYNTDSINVLEGLDAVRKRPGMYIGSTDSRGLQHCLWEIVDNSVDEAISGYCNKIAITLKDDGSVEVSDNGRGIPVEYDKKSKISGVEIVFTKLHAGGKFGSDSYKNSGGLHGVGASVVNALSHKLSVEVLRDGVLHRLDFLNGEAGNYKDELFTKSHYLEQKKVSTLGSGTTVRYWYDPNIFSKDSKVDFKATLERARQTSYLVPGLEIAVTEEVSGESYTFKSEGGISDFIRDKSDGNLLSDVLYIVGDGFYNETVPVLENNKLISKEIERKMEVEVSFTWLNDYVHEINSFVNIIATPKGGTHLSGLNKSLVKIINESAKELKYLKNSDENLTIDDIYEGLRLALLVRISEPQFEGQTKEILGTTAATSIVNEVVYNGIKKIIHDKARKKDLEVILTKITNAMKARVSAKLQRETIRRKTALENSSSLPTKLSDCRTRDLERSELILIEGDSAGGTVKASRDSEFQALMPLRGKILNVMKSSEKQMLDNAECASIISAMGAGSGETFRIANIRYGKLIFMTDADVDGSHIRCLLLTLCYRYLKPMLEEGRIYAAMPPLYRIEISGKKDYIYCYSDYERDIEVEKLNLKNEKIKNIQRYKGLGEMDADQLHETTMDISKRKLRKIKIEDSEKASIAFEMLMGNEVTGRKDFISINGGLLDRSKIDT